MCVSPADPLLAPFDATIERYGEASDECTIAPYDVSDHSRQTTWITAKEGSFCSAEARC